ncbi:TIGR00341 family protein [Calidifontibacillus oryziterrae]|uniref:TIGR00341 family protein n=1 Tax=Calidifontibacillus oryziterrae TaxID=1191699 RepID=UPI0002EE0D10|nr:TIGR00341 family protein [Calidifontibacillus oryziterrae]
MEPVINQPNVVDVKKKNKYLLEYETREKIIETIRTDSQPDAYYYIMVVLSCSVATYGLLSNSTAVIIGAMLIAPLMNPILGGGLALITGNNRLLRVTIKAELMGAVIAIILSTLLTLLLPVSHLTPEILARTEPTFIDLIIALASGAAGTYAICYRSGATLPGVAIATALMPPLCVVGISLAKQEFQMAGGALLLFIANMVAINVIAILIFKFAGFTTPSISKYLNLHVSEDKNTYFSRLVENKIIYPITLLLLVSIPLVILLNGSIEADKKEKLIRGAIEEGLAVLAPDAKIVSLQYTEAENSFQINTELNSAQIILPEDIRKIENSLEYKLTAPVHLVADVSIIQKVSNEASTDGLKSLLPKPEKEVVTVVQTEAGTPEEIIEQVIIEKLALFNGVLDDFSFEYRRGTGTYNVLLNVTTPEPLDQKFVVTIENVLEEKLKRKVIATLQEEIEPPLVENEDIKDLDPSEQKDKPFVKDLEPNLDNKEQTEPGPEELNAGEIVPRNKK